MSTIGFLFVGVAVLRLLFSLVVVRTADVPDEWWQSTEVAYFYAFGKGELTWEWREGIRAYIYPLPFYMIFEALKTLGLDTPTLVWAVPRIFTALISAGVDFYTHKLALRSFGPRVARMALLLSLLNWFTGFITVRTQSNVAEGYALLLAAVNVTNFPWFLFWAGFGVALRVTFILPAVPLFFGAIAAARRQRVGWGNILVSTIFLVGLWLGIISAVDRYFYGYWSCTPWEFLMFNVFKGLSALFGTHSVHWYFSQAIPIMAFTTGIPLFFLPFVKDREIINTIKPPNHNDERAAIPRDKIASTVRERAFLFYLVVATTLVGYSLLPHKEFRFVYPVLPLLIILSALAMSSHTALVNRRRSIVMTIAFTNMIMLGLFGVFFQRGTVDVMTHIRHQPATLAQLDVLTGCHATPGYSYVHGKVDSLRTMNCTVLIDEKTKQRLPTQHHLFTQHPVEFAEWAYEGTPAANSTLQSLFASVVEGKSWPLPDAIICFEKYADQLSEFLRRNRFGLDRRFWHTFFVLEDDMDKNIDLWVREA